jgi:hypothetical protein
MLISPSLAMPGEIEPDSASRALTFIGSSDEKLA